MTMQTTPSSNPETPLLTGAEILVKCLEHEAVDTIFAYPGGASMPIHQALTRSQIRTILPRHEQGGAFAAEGYARVTGKAGVVMATSGPGATNLITGIADAYLDSVPLVAITGQVASPLIGKGAFQETDMFGMSLPVVKHNYLILNAADIPRVVKEAFYIAQTGRPGPVLIDLPKNVQEAKAPFVFPETVNLPGYNPSPKASDEALGQMLELVAGAKQPVIYAGGGIISGEASAELLEFVERTGIPVATTLMGVGGFPEDHPLSLKWLGMHGMVYANNAVNEADVVLAISVRFDDRVTSKVERFCERATIVHLDIDASEINKNKPVALGIQSDVKYALTRLNAMLEARGKTRSSAPCAYPAWYAKIDAWKQQFPMVYRNTEKAIMQQYVVALLCEMTQGEAIITTGVGQHQMWTGQFFNFRKPRTFLTSGGLGTMGFGYPAAIGAKVARPELEVIDIDGDGSFLMNVQELATAHIERIAAKAIILNNQHLGMVVQWEDLKYGSNRAHTYLGDPKHKEQIYPDYVAICAGFGVKCERVTHKADLKPAIQRMLDAKEPYILDVLVPYTEHVLPMIPGGMSYKDVIINPAQSKLKAEDGAKLPTAL